MSVDLPKREFVVIEKQDETKRVLRIATFNCLADKYCDAAAFPYIDPKYTKWDYRFPLILAEIKRTDADIICLQEVDKCDFFRKELCDNGPYDMVYSRVDTNQIDSPRLVTLWKKSRFGLESSQRLFLDEDQVYKSRAIVTKFHEFAANKDDEYVEFSIVNVHLKSKPEFAEARVAEIKDLLRMWNTAAFIVGDFNDVPDSTTISIMRHFPLMFSVSEYNEAHDSTDCDIKKTPSTCTSSKYRQERRSTVSDYIFYKKRENLKAIAYLSRFDPETVNKNLLPCETYGSDHLLTAAEFIYY